VKDSEGRDRLLADEMRTHLRVIAMIAQRGKARFRGPEGEESRYAAIQAVELPGEAAEKISGPFEKANPKIPWKSLRPSRKRVAHPYDGEAEPVNVDELWVFMVRDAPRIERSLLRPTFPDVGDGGNSPQ
jgi:uncharacterized protein with HEPN domain